MERLVSIRREDYLTYVDNKKCIGCGICLPYCPLEAISLRDGKAWVDPDLCADCWVCLRKKVCPKEALQAKELTDFYQVFRHVLCDPVETFADTGVTGRGTEECKTNDVTGRYRRGEVGLAVDMGRPGLGCTLRDVEKVAMALAAAGAELAGPEETPLAQLMTDLTTGKLMEEVLQEPNLTFLSIIIEAKCREERLRDVLKALQKVEQEVDTVFSLGLIIRPLPDGTAPVLKVLDELGIARPVRGKVNVGLGRPIAEA
jgi:Fe-S-cluster-containing hydrogenase component 2